MFEIIINKKVNKFVNNLPNSEKILAKLSRLKYFKSGQNLGIDIACFKGKNKNKFRVRIGELRFIFEVVVDKIFIDAGDYRGRIYL